MNKLSEEQKDHFSGERNHWCIVSYVNNSPLYYCGYFADAYDSEVGHNTLKPAFTFDFNNALKLHSRIAADDLLRKLRGNAPESVKGCKVEDHMWFAAAE